MKLCSLLGLLVLFVFCVVGEEPNLLPEPGLTNPKIWPKENGYQIKPGMGRNGGNALVYVRTNPAEYPLPGIGVPLPPGNYEFGGWVHCTQADKNNVSGAICMQISTNGKHLGGSYRSQVKGPGDWRHISATLTVPAGKNIKVQFVPYMLRGDTGTVRFADMYVRRSAPKLYCFVLEPRMFNALPAGLNKLVLGTEIQNADQTDCELRLKLSGEHGDIAKKRISDPGKRIPVEFDFPATGNYNLLCELYGKGGKKIAEDIIPLAVTAQAPQSPVVTLDPNGRVTVNGKKFFPIGIYTLRKQSAKKFSLEQELELIAKGGFNCLVPYDGLEFRLSNSKAATREEALTEVFDYLGRLDLKILPSLDYVRKGKREEMKKIVEALRHHPALLAWYFYDEPPLKERTALRELCRELNLQDPNHPAVGITLAAGESPLYAGTANIYALDIYPIYGSTTEIPNFNNALKVFYSGIATEKGAPFWFAPQWFSWKCYSATNTSDLFRWPSEEEALAISVLAVLRGANGLLFYSFFDMFKYDDFEEKWPQLCRVVAILNEFAPFALGDAPEIALRSSEQIGNVHYRGFRADDGREAVAIVALGGKSAVTLKLPGNWKSRLGKTKLDNQGRMRFTADTITCDILYRY